MTKNLFNLILGIVLFIAFIIFREGTYWLVESQDSGGKNMGALAEFWYSMLLMVMSGIATFKIFKYAIKLLSKNSAKSILNLLPIIIGFIASPGIYNAYKSYKISNIVDEHMTNHKLAANYVTNEFESYKDIYQIVNDSIDSWVIDSLGIIVEEIRSSPNFTVDSLIVFNSEMNRFRATTYYSYIYFRNKYSTDYRTGYRNIYGLKHNQEWTVIPDPISGACLIGGLYNMKTSEYPLKKLTMMNRIYQIKGILNPTQIEIPMVNRNRGRVKYKFDTLSITMQKNIIDSLFTKYKTYDINDDYYDSAGSYRREWRYQRKLKKAKRINKQIFSRIKD